MIRKRILLASLLKPVQDTRLYEKLAQSLAQLPEFEVHVAGFQTQGGLPEVDPPIISHPIFKFKRISLGRLKAQGRFRKLLHELKPQILVVATHELLVVAARYCQKHKCQLVYDVQENYHLNLSTQGVYPAPLAKLLASIARAVEKKTAPIVSHFLLAEAAYAQELPFVGQRFTILQNKYQPPLHSNPTPRKTPVTLQASGPLRLLYSGTISRLYGALEAVDFCVQLQNFLPATQLTIMGYCAEASFLQELQEKIKPYPFIQLVGGQNLVPHHEILLAQTQHQIGLLPYHSHPSTKTCVPTKLFEYLGNGLITLLPPNPVWEQVLHQAGGGLSFDFRQPVTPAFVQKLLATEYYYSNGIPEEVFWAEERAVVQTLFRKLAAEGA